jgi:hypothetical protein
MVAVLGPFEALPYYIRTYIHHVKEDEMRRGQKGNTYRMLVVKREGKRPLGRLRRRWEDNIKMDLRRTGWCGMDWIHLGQDTDQWRALVNTAMNFSRWTRLHVSYLVSRARKQI